MDRKMERDEELRVGETLYAGSAALESLCYDWSVFQLPSPLLPPVFIVALGVMRQFASFPPST